MRYRARAFIVMDVAIGLGALLLVLGLLMTTLSQSNRVQRRLADRREALHQAEAILTQLQTGETPGALPPQVHLKELPSTTTLPWYQVQVQRGEETVTLVGALPQPAPHKRGEVLP